MTKGIPYRVQLPPRMNLACCQQCGSNICFICIGTRIGTSSIGPSLTVPTMYLCCVLIFVAYWLFSNFMKWKHRKYNKPVSLCRRESAWPLSQHFFTWCTVGKRCTTTFCGRTGAPSVCLSWWSSETASPVWGRGSCTTFMTEMMFEQAEERWNVIFCLLHQQDSREGV